MAKQMKFMQLWTNFLGIDDVPVAPVELFRQLNTALQCIQGEKIRTTDIAWHLAMLW